jgi:two-component system chemotaxis response regulator CheB
MSAIRKAGGLTIAESEQTCIVYGMPREAIHSGVVDKVLPLAEIGETVIRKCQGAA